jgi:hypothetical protein
MLFSFMVVPIMVARADSHTLKFTFLDPNTSNATGYWDGVGGTDAADKDYTTDTTTNKPQTADLDAIKALFDVAKSTSTAALVGFKCTSGEYKDHYFVKGDFDSTNGVVKDLEFKEDATFEPIWKDASGYSVTFENPDKPSADIGGGAGNDLVLTTDENGLLDSNAPTSLNTLFVVTATDAGRTIIGYKCVEGPHNLVGQTFAGTTSTTILTGGTYIGGAKFIPVFVAQITVKCPTGEDIGNGDNNSIVLYCDDSGNLSGSDKTIIENLFDKKNKAGASVEKITDTTASPVGEYNNKTAIGSFLNNTYVPNTDVILELTYGSAPSGTGVTGSTAHTITFDIGKGTPVQITTKADGMLDYATHQTEMDNLFNTTALGGELEKWVDNKATPNITIPTLDALKTYTFSSDVTLFAVFKNSGSGSGSGSGSPSNPTPTNNTYKITFTAPTTTTELIPTRPGNDMELETETNGKLNYQTYQTSMNRLFNNTVLGGELEKWESNNTTPTITINSLADLRNQVFTSNVTFVAVLKNSGSNPTPVPPNHTVTFKCLPDKEWFGGKGVDNVVTVAHGQCIPEEDAQQVFGVKNESKLLDGWKITKGTNMNKVFYTVKEITSYPIMEDIELTSQWDDVIILRLSNINPFDKKAYIEEHVPKGYVLNAQKLLELVNIPQGYELVNLEYVTGGIKGDSYDFKTPMNVDTELLLNWKEVKGGASNGDVVKGDGASDDEESPSKKSYYSSLSNPKTGDVGLVPYIGVMVVSVLGAASLVKLGKKEK